MGLSKKKKNYIFILNFCQIKSIYSVSFTPKSEAIAFDLAAVNPEGTHKIFEMYSLVYSLLVDDIILCVMLYGPVEFSIISITFEVVFGASTIVIYDTL